MNYKLLFLFIVGYACTLTEENFPEQPTISLYEVEAKEYSKNAYAGIYVFCILL
jgi:hypothetical protein